MSSKEIGISYNNEKKYRAVDTRLRNTGQRAGLKKQRATLQVERKVLRNIFKSYFVGTVGGGSGPIEKWLILTES